jgi:hypothetical protein
MKKGAGCLARALFLGARLRGLGRGRLARCESVEGLAFVGMMVDGHAFGATLGQKDRNRIPNATLHFSDIVVCSALEGNSLT